MRNFTWASWASIALAVLSLGAIASNAVLQRQNQGMQSEINQRQQFINQSAMLGRVYEALLRELAGAAVSNKDDKLRSLLAQAGFTLTVNPAPANAAAAAAPSPLPQLKSSR